MESKDGSGRNAKTELDSSDADPAASVGAGGESNTARRSDVRDRDEGGHSPRTEMKTEEEESDAPVAAENLQSYPDEMVGTFAILLLVVSRKPDKHFNFDFLNIRRSGRVFFNLTTVNE
jgi:hypothetical protein